MGREAAARDGLLQAIPGAQVIKPVNQLAYARSIVGQLFVRPQPVFDLINAFAKDLRFNSRRTVARKKTFEDALTKFVHYD
jgi:hypothetical protein